MAPPPENAITSALASATPLVPLNPTDPPTVAARALTEAGCCAGHWWAADSTRLLFIDDPEGASPLGIYAVATEGGEVSLVSTSLSGADLAPGDVPPDLSPILGPDYRVAADARNIRLSPDGTSVAWTVGSNLPVNVDRRQRSLWVAAGTPDLGRRLAVLTGGDLVGWAQDGEAVVTTGRVAADGVPGIWRVPIDGRSPTLLAEGQRPRGARLSPSARWLVYYLAFEADPARNGVWIVGASGEPARKLPSFGSYRWGSNERLYFIPFGSEGQPLTLASFDPATGAAEVVRDAEPFPGGIAVNDWSVSPDGRWVAYRSAADAALWIVPTGSG
jgi:hypothetical protein